LKTITTVDYLIVRLFKDAVSTAEYYLDRLWHGKW